MSLDVSSAILLRCKKWDWLKRAFNRFISKHNTHDLHDAYFPKKVLYLGLYMNSDDQRILIVPLRITLLRLKCFMLT